MIIPCFLWAFDHPTSAAEPPLATSSLNFAVTRSLSMAAVAAWAEVEER